MKMPARRIVFGCALIFVGALSLSAQDSPPSQPSPGAVQMPNDGGPRPIGGRITKISDSAMVLERREGEPLTVKITDKTQFRKDRQPAKLSDFKVGDIVFVRGQENADHSVTAETIGQRPAGGPGGGFSGGPMGTLGKDFVVGEVTALDPPKLTILRVDQVSQTIELNEQTSLRKGRESVTMTDIQAGDHVMARGAVQNDIFVPTTVIVFTAEQWKRIQEMRMNGGPGGATNSGQPPQNSPAQNPPAQNPPQKDPSEQKN